MISHFSRWLKNKGRKNSQSSPLQRLVMVARTHSRMVRAMSINATKMHSKILMARALVARANISADSRPEGSKASSSGRSWTMEGNDVSMMALDQWFGQVEDNSSSYYLNSVICMRAALQYLLEIPEKHRHMNRMSRGEDSSTRKGKEAKPLRRRDWHVNWIGRTHRFPARGGGGGGEGGGGVKTHLCGPAAESLLLAEWHLRNLHRPNEPPMDHASTSSSSLSPHQHWDTITRQITTAHG